MIARACGLVVLGGVLAAVAVVPLLVDPWNPANVYYAVKARALYVLAPPVALAWLGRAWLRPAAIDRAVVAPALAFAAVAVAATWGSVHPAWSLWGAPWRNEGLLTLLAYVALFLASAALRDPAGRTWWRAATLAGASGVAAYGIAQYLGYDWLARDWQRAAWWQAFSTTGNPNWLGAYVVLVLPLALAAVATAGRASGRLAGAVALVLLGLTAMYTYGRAAWLALVLAVAVASALVLRRRRALPARRYLGALLLLLGAVAVAPFLRSPLGPASGLAVPPGPASGLAVPPGPAGLAAPLARAESMAELQDNSLQLRFYLWRETLPLLRRRPLLGYGPETFPLVFPQRQEATRRFFGDARITIDKAHSETLDMAMSLGVLGVAAFWWLVLVSLGRAWAAARAGGAPAMLGIACLAGILGYLVDLQVHFSVVSVAPVFWSVLGVAAGLVPTTGSDAAPAPEGRRPSD